MARKNNTTKNSYAGNDEQLPETKWRKNQGCKRHYEGYDVHYSGMFPE